MLPVSICLLPLLNNAYRDGRHYKCDLEGFLTAARARQVRFTARPAGWMRPKGCRKAESIRPHRRPLNAPEVKTSGGWGNKNLSAIRILEQVKRRGEQARICDKTIVIFPLAGAAAQHIEPMSRIANSNIRYP